MRAEDVNFESMMEGNDSILPTNLQEPPPPLTNIEKQNTEKITPSNRLKSGIKYIFLSNILKKIFSMIHNLDYNYRNN